MRNRPIELVARTGYAARGTVYVLMGALALLAAFGRGGKAVGAKGALAELLGQPFGAVLLGLIAAGFLCFAVWRLAQALLDADHLGTDAKALRKRAGRLIGAVINVGLAGSAISVMLGSSGSDDGSARDWTAAVLSVPFGQWLVGLVGAGIAATGLAFLRKGWTCSFADQLAPSAQARAWVMPLGRYGYIARGVLFGIVGGFLVTAAVHANAREAKGLAGALQTLQQQPYGWALLAAAAAGLFAFGAFMLVTARYRRIDAPRAGDAGRKLKQQGRAMVEGGKRALSG